MGCLENGAFPSSRRTCLCFCEEKIWQCFAHGWNHLGHLLSFDQPVGTGYSSVHAEPGSTEGYVDSQEMMAAQLYTGLQRFFDAHPELVSNPFYVAGESYGKYTEQCLTKPGILSFTKPESPNANSRKVHPQHKLFDTCEESHGR